MEKNLKIWYVSFTENYQHSSVNIVSRLQAGQPRNHGSVPLKENRFVSSTLGPTLPLIKWLPGPISQGVKRLGYEADRLFRFSAEVKTAWGNIFIPHTSA
jgi:hypothetical protein